MWKTRSPRKLNILTWIPFMEDVSSDGRSHWQCPWWLTSASVFFYSCRKYSVLPGMLYGIWVCHIFYLWIYGLIVYLWIYGLKRGVKEPTWAQLSNNEHILPFFEIRYSNFHTSTSVVLRSRRAKELWTNVGTCMLSNVQISKHANKLMKRKD